MNRDPDLLRANALVSDETISLPELTASRSELQAEPTGPAAAEVAVLIGFVNGGDIPLILRLGELTAQRAETLVALRGEHIGRRVALIPLRGTDTKWLVMGLLAGQSGWSGIPAAGLVEVYADGRHITIQANDEITLRCGKSRISLRADGRIEIRGETIISEAVRANRVRGGSVELN